MDEDVKMFLFCEKQDADDSKDHKNVFLSDFLDLEDIGYRSCHGPCGTWYQDLCVFF